MEKPYIEIAEVCPRDGWQNHRTMISTETKIKYIRKMIDYGAPVIDAASFVNPRRVPQMADADAVIRGIAEYAGEKKVRLLSLALNKRGVERAAELGMRNVQFVLSVSELHNQRNSNRSIAESLEELLRLRDVASGMNVILALTCVFGSPFGDEIDLDRVLSICDTAKEAGILEVGLADTAGLSDPVHTREVLRYLGRHMELDRVSVHLHNTEGMGMANAYVAIEAGVRKLDGALAGMGGCPFAPGAKGNIASEDLVGMCEKMGYRTGYDLQAMTAASREMCAEVQAECGSFVTQAWGKL